MSAPRINRRKRRQSRVTLRTALTGLYFQPVSVLHNQPIVGQTTVEFEMSDTDLVIDNRNTEELQRFQCLDNATSIWGKAIAIEPGTPGIMRVVFDRPFNLADDLLFAIPAKWQTVQSNSGASITGTITDGLRVRAPNGAPLGWITAQMGQQRQADPEPEPSPPVKKQKAKK